MVKKFNDFNWDWDYEEVEQIFNISKDELKEILKLIDELIIEKGYDKYQSPSINLGKLMKYSDFPTSVSISKQIHIFKDKTKNSQKLFFLEYISSIEDDSYMVNYFDSSNIDIKNGKFNIIKTLIEQWK